MTSLRGPGERNFNAVSHKPSRAPIQFNRPFPSSKKSHFQNEAKCETFVVKMSFICIIIENHFHINGFALNLVLKVRFFGTRKWPIQSVSVSFGLWDTALKFLSPGPRNDVTDHLERTELPFVFFLIEKEKWRLYLNRVTLHSKGFRAVSDQRTRIEKQRPREKWH